MAFSVEVLRDLEEKQDRSGKWKTGCEDCFQGLYPLGRSIVVPVGLLIDWRDSLRGLSMPGHQF